MKLLRLFCGEELVLPTRSSCRANSPWLAGVLRLVSYRCIPVDSARPAARRWIQWIVQGQRRGGGSHGRGGLAWTTWLLRLQIPSRCLGLLFVELPSSGARCTLFVITRRGEPGPAARACTVQWSTGCCRWTARVVSTACRIRRRTPGRRRYARWQRSARLRGRYQTSFSGQACTHLCTRAHVF